MSAYTEFFLKSKRGVVNYQTVQIDHPDLSKSYKFVRNKKDFLTVLTEENSAQHTFVYLPMQIRQKTVTNDLDFGFEFQLGTVGDDLKKDLTLLNKVTELDPDSGYGIKPKVVYREYRSDDLTQPMFGPIHLELETISYTREGVAFEAVPPQLNMNRTGELYTLERFPMLAGFMSFNSYVAEPSYLEFMNGERINLMDGSYLELEN